MQTVRRIYVARVKRFLTVLCCRPAHRRHSPHRYRVSSHSRTASIQTPNPSILTLHSISNRPQQSRFHRLGSVASRSRPVPPLQPVRNVAVLKSVSVGVQLGVSIVTANCRSSVQGPLPVRQSSGSDTAWRRQSSAQTVPAEPLESNSERRRVHREQDRTRTQNRYQNRSQNRLYNQSTRDQTQPQIQPQLRSTRKQFVYNHCNRSTGQLLTGGGSR